MVPRLAENVWHKISSTVYGPDADFVNKGKRFKVCHINQCSDGICTDPVSSLVLQFPNFPYAIKPIEPHFEPIAESVNK